MLEVLGEQLLGEFSDVPDDEAVAGASPRNDGGGRLVLNHLVALAEERSERSRSVAARLHHVVASPENRNPGEVGQED